ERLPDYYQQRVRRTLSASDRAGADTIVEELRAIATAGCPPTLAGDDAAQTTGVNGTDGADGGTSSSDQATITVDVLPGQHPLTRLLDLGDALGTTPEAATAPDAATTSTGDTTASTSATLPQGCP
ncbi:MAG: serine/threonine-protein phosphatase, partial [Ornithinimicrobium sp.]|nr:serine/threonine-protein phosphatase [Ornithinimicrobium sp.]